MKYLIISVFSLLLISCSDKKENLSLTRALLEGYWIQPAYLNDSMVIFQRATGLTESDYGLEFGDHGAFTERKNAGWCGTPPIVYSDFHGTWSLDDAMVYINVGYWGGTAYYKWKVLNLTPQELNILIVSQNYSPPGG